LAFNSIGGEIDEPACNLKPALKEPAAVSFNSAFGFPGAPHYFKLYAFIGVTLDFQLDLPSS